MKKSLNKVPNDVLLVETLQEMGFHTMSLRNSKYPSTIWNIE
jgi:hypothetical protein